MNASEGSTLRLTWTLPAGRNAVWRAMTDPGELPKWWGPKGFEVPRLDFEPRVGQSYRIAMQPPEGDLFHLDGEFREVDAPDRLAYTFRWDPPDPDDRETLVTLTLRAGDEGTEVELVQGEFATDERLELHHGGWSDSFEKLRELLA